ncbi:MAG: IMP dehydrogenase/GMP reductase [Candidatus Poriferisodalaceae bacterium]
MWNLLAGLRSSMSYSDSTTLKEFAKKSEFIRVTPLGFPENTPHATTRTT